MGIPDVDCVVLNWHDVPRTLRAVRALLGEELVRSVVVVDSESTGDLRRELEILQDPRIDIVESPHNTGFANGVNRGLRRILAKQEDGYILALNNDAHPFAGALEQMHDVLASSDGVGIVAPLICNANGEVESGGGRFRVSTMSSRHVSAQMADGPVDYLTWACVLIARECLITVGLLDESFFMYWEDVDFGRRVTEAGYHQLVVSQAMIRHEISSSHSRAGYRISLYSSMGMVVLAKRCGRVAKIGMLYRLGRRFFGAILMLDVRRAVAVLRGARLASQVQFGRPACEVLRCRGLVR